MIVFEAATGISVMSADQAPINLKLLVQWLQ